MAEDERERCNECGGKVQHLNSNVCDGCLEAALSDLEPDTEVFDLE